MTKFTSEFIAEARSSITETGVERYICIPVQIEMLDEIERLQSRIAELEAEIDQLTAHDATERQDDKLSNDTQTQTFVYRKEDSEVQDV